MHWKIKAALQNILSRSRLGDRINHLHGSIQRDYYSRGVRYGFNQLVSKLELIDRNRRGTDMSKSACLEIGTGYFLVQPIILKLLGWGNIITVDISQDIFFSALKKQLTFLLQESYLAEIRKSSTLDPADLNHLLDQLGSAASLNHILNLCGITYIAPYNFEDIDNQNVKFDFIFSQVVLEHIPPETLGKLFSHTKKWLKPGGHIVHIVNFTDHFANPGLMGDKGISEFNFLRYSDDYWEFWAGNPIAYTNRLGFPYYYQLCEKNDLKVAKFIKEDYKERKPFNIENIHPDIIARYDNVSPDDLVSVQRGTFLITHK